MALFTDRLVEKSSNATPSLQEPVRADIYRLEIISTRLLTRDYNNYSHLAMALLFYKKLIAANKEVERNDT